jgi:hypothetical protein
MPIPVIVARDLRQEQNMTHRHTVLAVLALASFATAQDQPRVLLTSASKGSSWNSTRDQTIELTKDFQKDCTQVRVTTLQDKADYTVTLNHIEHGFARDNQFLVSNKEGDVLYTKEGGSIDKNVKYACGVIQKDWKPKSEATTAPAPESK